MKRDDLIKLIRATVPKDGNVCVENCNIHDDTIEVVPLGGDPGGGPLTMRRPRKWCYLLQGKVGP